MSRTIHSNQQKFFFGVEFSQFSVRPLNGHRDVSCSTIGIIFSLSICCCYKSGVVT